MLRAFCYVCCHQVTPVKISVVVGEEALQRSGEEDRWECPVCVESYNKDLCSRCRIVKPTWQDDCYLCGVCERMYHMEIANLKRENAILPPPPLQP